jgi:hypothetical protein
VINGFLSNCGFAGLSDQEVLTFLRQISDTVCIDTLKSKQGSAVWLARVHPFYIFRHAVMPGV